jgi:hypothetical protein
MNWVLPVVIGTTAVFYVHSFNHIMKLYAESGYTLTWRELLDKNLTIAGL